MNEAVAKIRAWPAAEKFAAFSGCVWGLIAYFIGIHVYGGRIWGGLVFAPVIGVTIGRLTRLGDAKPRWIRAFVTLSNLYIAAICLALAIALFQLPRELRFASTPAIIAKYVLSMIHGLTFSGYIFILWPLSYINHRLFWPDEAGTAEFPPRVPLTASAIRIVAHTIIGLSAVAYLLYAVMQWLTMTTTEMPWWVMTDVMGWSNWTVLGTLVWLTAPVVSYAAIRATGTGMPAATTYADLVGFVGFVVFLLPLYFYTSQLIVTMSKITLMHSWATEGTVLAESYYYRNVFSMNAPCLALGCALMAARRLL